MTDVQKQQVLINAERCRRTKEKTITTITANKEKNDFPKPESFSLNTSKKFLIKSAVQ